jgi:hypothetical protein
VAAGDGAVVGGGLLDAPADALAGAGEDFILAALDLVPELAGVGLPCHCVSFGDDIVAVASGLDGAEEGPAEVGFGFGEKDHRDDAIGQGFLQEGGQAGADAVEPAVRRR